MARWPMTHREVARRPRPSREERKRGRARTRRMMSGSKAKAMAGRKVVGRKAMVEQLVRRHHCLMLTLALSACKRS